MVVHCWFSICLLKRLFSDVWSENAALFKRLMKIHSNPPILYYGFKAISPVIAYSLIKRLVLLAFKANPIHIHQSWFVHVSFSHSACDPGGEARHLDGHPRCASLGLHRDSQAGVQAQASPQGQYPCLPYFGKRMQVTKVTFLVTEQNVYHFHWCK